MRGAFIVPAMLTPRALIAILLTCAFPIAAEPPEVQRELIHSDVPLWGNETERRWPRSFEDGADFGCTTRIRYGDWRFDLTDGTEDPAWYRWTNYGMFHCFMLVRESGDRDGLNRASSDPSWLIELGETPGPSGPVELWVLQRGSRPGSSYLLLSRKKGGGIITQFDVLQTACPPAHMRKGPPVSILMTAYCAINDRAVMIKTARRMAKLPPQGRLTFVAPEPDEK